MSQVTPANVDNVDPDIREFHRITSEDHARLMADADGSMASRRLVAEEVRAPWRVGGPNMAHVDEQTTLAGVRVRIYTPPDAEAQRVLIYLHGGGWVMFSLDTHDRLMREYAARAQTIVIGVDYSLSPEAPYPQALNEVLSVVESVVSGELVRRSTTPKIILGGDSAGANLAIATAQRLRDEQKSSVDGLLLNYGVYDSKKRSSHLVYDGDNYMLTSAEMDVFWKAYLGNNHASALQYAKPLRVDAARLPRTFMCIAECDILYDENLEMAERLQQSGVDITKEVYPGATHSFLEAVSISTLASKALDDASRWLRQFK